MIESKLTFYDHITISCSKANQKTGASARVSKF